jgi:hypothetical protein
MAPPPYYPKINVAGSEYFPPPYSALNLPPGLRYGLVPVGLLATLSLAATSALILFILSRFVSWRQHYKTFIGYNQYVVLVLNLLLADFQQSAALVLSFHWIREDYILAPHPVCLILRVIPVWALTDWQ